MSATDQLQSNRRESPQSIAAAISEVSERATMLIHEEIELAKSEVSEKISRLMRGAIVAIVAGIFVVAALVFALHGLAWLAWYELPTEKPAIFWGFFIVAGALLLLGALAGFIAARAVKASAPPVPKMAIEEARKIRESVNVGVGAGAGFAAEGDGAAEAQTVATER